MKTIPLYNAFHTPEMETVALEVLRSGRIASGEYVFRFESEFEKLVNQRHVVSTVDMTSAVYLALYLAGVGPGDEVLTTAYACLSTNSAIAQIGAVPVWVDLLPSSIEIDLADLALKVSKKTKAVLLYHPAGYPGPIQSVAKFCRQHKIAFIEDCNNALLATRDGRFVGSEGDFAIYSFYPNRQINAVEGGVLVCRSEEAAIQARKLRRFGIDSKTFRTVDGEISPSSDISKIGWSFSLNNLCAALACTQISTVNERIAKTRENARKLNQIVSELKRVEAVRIPEGANPSYWVFLVLSNQRDELIRKLKEQGVFASAVHQRNDIYSGFGSRKDHLPNTTDFQKRVLGVPCGWWISESDLTVIARALNRSVRETDE